MPKNLNAKCFFYRIFSKKAMLREDIKLKQKYNIDLV